MDSKIKIHPVLTCDENKSIQDIASILKKENQRRVFVIDSKKALKGIITTTDLVYKALALGKYELKAKDIMTKKVEHIDFGDNLEKALGVMNATKSFICPVTKDDKLIGVIAHHELIQFLTVSK